MEPTRKEVKTIPRTKKVTPKTDTPKTDTPKSDTPKSDEIPKKVSKAKKDSKKAKK